MFEQLIINNYTAHLQKMAVPFIKIERDKDDIIYNFIIKFISDKKLLISDTDLILNKQLYWGQIQIYDISADTIAKQLIKQLCETFGHKFILKVLDNDKLYSIEYNLKKICVITSIKLHKQYSINDFILPNKVVVNNLDILLLPPLLEVINNYKDLYSPVMAEDWPDILLTIQQLEIFVEKDLKNILSNKSTNNKIDVPVISTLGKKIPKQMQLKRPLLDFFADTDYLILDHTIKDDTTLVIISQNNIEFDIKLLSNYLSKFVTFGIVYQEKELYIPKEFAMKKILVYITYNDGVDIKKKHILSIYNNLSYELINFNTLLLDTNTYKIVDPITELRII